MKNGLIGAGIAAVTILGAYSLFSGSGTDSYQSSRFDSSDTFIRTDDPYNTRSEISPGIPDKDCADFRTQQEAQSFFISNGGPAEDSHNLDKDGDGQVCESLP